MTVLPFRDDTGADHPALAAAWRDRRRGGLSSYPVLTSAGLVLGTGTLLAKRSKDAWASQALDVDADRLLALLAIAYDRPHTAGQARHILAKVQAAGRALAVGEPVQAAIHLAHAGLGVLPDADNAACCLFLAEMLLDQGMTPAALIKIASGSFTKYSPDQPRDDHGRWTAGASASTDAPASAGPRFLVSPDAENSGLSRTLAARAAASTAAASKQWRQAWLTQPHAQVRAGLGSAERSAEGQEANYGYMAFKDNGGDNALGRYQLLDSSLRTLGLKSSANDWATEFGRKYNIKSDGDFLRSEDAQEAALTPYLNDLEKHTADLNQQYNGRTYVGVLGDSITITKAGLIAAAHREGPVAVRRYILKYGAGVTKGKKLSKVEMAVEKRIRLFQDITYGD